MAYFFQMEDYTANDISVIPINFQDKMGKLKSWKSNLMEL